MTPKDLFQNNKEACKAHNAAINESWFQYSLACSKAEMFERDVNSDMLKGARMLEEIFIGLSDFPGEPITFNTGVRHDVDNPTPEKPKTQE